MAQWLNRSMAAAEQASVEDTVQATVQGLLADIAARGEGAVREMSAKFDGWDRTDFRLADPEIRACLSELPARATWESERGSAPLAKAPLYRLSTARSQWARSR